MIPTSSITGAKVLLAYVSYPVTTAAYLERALRQKQNVVTAGPKIGPEIIKNWNLENMKLPVLDHQIPLDLTPDMGEILNRTTPDNYPDLYVWSESVHGYFPKGLDTLTCPKACYFVDSHLNLDWHVEWARNFDHVFIAQREYLDDFRRAGSRNVHWLPLACDPDVHRRTTSEKTYEVGFVGSLNNDRRQVLLEKIRSVAQVEYQRCFWDDMADVFSKSKIVFNNAVRNDLNMRLFEVMSTGTFVLTDLARKSGQEILFHDGEDLGVYDDATVAEKVLWYLSHDHEREAIAGRGQRLVHAAHTYAHRMDELINVALGGAPNTPSAEEWRERAMAGVDPLPSQPGRERLVVPSANAARSFVIPVLDMSPASPYNFETLLKDLTAVEGDVIAVFNSTAMADKFRNHPRITRSASLSQNVGVARAWNIGLHMSTTPVTFIMNADLHVQPEAVNAIEHVLLSVPNAAIAGPQGSYVNFEATKDFQYFDKGTFPKPFAVDAVSGFFFAVRTESFSAGPLAFEDAFTPCYFEEWDIGLQCKRAGLSCYLVPTTGYDHEWSGSIRALRTIRYFDNESTAGEILERNRKFFLEKWQEIARVEKRPDLLTSLRPPSTPATAVSFDSLIDGNTIHEARSQMEALHAARKADSNPLAFLAVFACVQGDEERARRFIDELRTTHPTYNMEQLAPMVERAARKYGLNVIARFDLLNMLIETYGYQRYLEIGVDGGESFWYIHAPLKHGVDPEPAAHATYPVTSDEFFATVAPTFREPYDLIFIDGLHHAEQVDRDIENALAFLAENGTIMLHDSNPPQEIIQDVPRRSVAWTGDVWKSILRLRMTRPDLAIMTVDTDWGCCVIRRGSQTLHVPDVQNPFTWEYLNSHRQEVLNLVSVAQFRESLREPVTQ